MKRRSRHFLPALAGLLLGGFPCLAEEAVPSGELAETIETAIGRGIAFLLEDQNADGSWGSARQTKGLNIYAPVPGAHDAFRTAVTAMAISALLDSGLAANEGPAREALDRAEAYLVEQLPKVRRATADAIYNVWSHAYGIQAFADLHRASADEERRARYVELINQQIDRLARYESIDGGWGYYDFRVGTARPSSSSISFTSATCLVAFREVSEIGGVALPERLVERALASIQRQRKADHSYLYGEYLDKRPLYGINRPAGSLGRSQACNLALRIWGDESVSDALVEEWLVRLRDRNGWLDIGRKRPIPHEAWFQVAGYFYYYGHYYAARCVELLPEERRPEFRRLVAELILPLQEKDGSWWDFPFYSYHQPYGTAFAVSTLARCRGAADEP